MSIAAYPPSDSPAIALYERFGFRVLDERGDACTMRATL